MNARRSVLATWRGLGSPRLESARLVLTDTGRLRAAGRAVAAAGEMEAYSAYYELLVDETGVTRRLTLGTTTRSDERHLSLSRGDDGFWLVDRGGDDVRRLAFDGAHDVDVRDSVLFNSLPVRRLGLHLAPGEHEFPVVWVSLPDLSVRLVRQTYRSVGALDDSAVVNFASGSFTSDITVDSDGLVVDYPGVAHRV
ncbi:hypothetical protein LX15_001755 [Streptoalloteichus tenebrarius]|uniref:Glycolipid-binding domain-containing protein n=1 Tax=Streptoalloteichus tenebrarius (strain ATCC 17920 / DSM 40477 / JCM 4838 / CBS 697.72 / NBRC 16177 / NCIMB 11028 / NRRL B-12390 / A12253. 1 / ISP 5477) TaxID=1933 RepID=A0ABT1HRG2_STRSD|nr:putative glycolipid-binding domain-containing protein [Streptoalloteichus tenebrarius]MCP2258068.1 hypothetical protein [Streptoalloteichus tenebrarius]BFF01739.1 putative glycolipid-binding domain-containing protein [Streptoalloteichus tenebrarius]